MAKSVRTVPREKSLGVKNPEALLLWDGARNAQDPFKVGAKSNIAVWWVCPVSAEHRYQKKVYAVTDLLDQGFGCCPFCSGRQVAPSESLAALEPTLALDWDSGRNSKTPSEVRADYGRAVHWRCHICQNQWSMSCSARKRDPRCCRCEPKQKMSYLEKVECGSITERQVSVASEHPEIASEWHPTKNGSFTAELAAPGGAQLVVWQCSIDASHEWKTSINNRTLNGSGCPFCAGKRASATTNLAVLHPELLAEWDFERNELDPYQCRPGSNAKAHWRCPKGPDHTWEMPIVRRVGGQGCTCCANLKLSVTNCVAAFPNALALWDEELNGKRATEVIAGGNAKWWWRCNEGPDHVWEAPALAIAKSGRGCPFCAGKSASVTNNLKALYPHIAAELDEPDLGAEDIIAHSHKRLRWRCAVDSSHTWEAVVKDRTLDAIGCPWCHTPNTSRREVELASELEILLGGDWNVRVTGASGQVWFCDYVNDGLKLIVEYDGNRWHADRSERDIRKTTDLEAAGWLVIRVREKGLTPISRLDFTMPSQWSTRHMTREVVQRLIDEDIVPPSTLDGYTKRKRPLGADLAEQRLLDVRTAQNHRDRAAGKAPRQRRRREAAAKPQAALVASSSRCSE